MTRGVEREEIQCTRNRLKKITHYRKANAMNMDWLKANMLEN